jgi:hypothetical protein
MKDSERRIQSSEEGRHSGPISGLPAREETDNAGSNRPAALIRHDLTPAQRAKLILLLSKQQR